MVTNVNAKIASNTLLTKHCRITAPNMVLPVNLLRPVNAWSKDDVQKWIEYCMDEYSLRDISANDFEMNGKALLLLNEDGFKQRAPRSGDILHKALQQHNNLVKSMNYRVFPYQYYGNFNLMPPTAMRHFNAALPQGSLTTLPLPAPSMSYLHPNLNYMFPCAERQNSADFIQKPQPTSTQRVPGSFPSASAKSYEQNNIPMSIPSVKQEFEDFKEFAVQKHEKFLTKPPESSLLQLPHQSNQLKSVKMHPDLYSRVKSEPKEINDTDESDTTKKIRYYQDRVDFHGDILMKPKAANNCRILWEFLYILLEDPSYGAIIHWEDRDRMIFRIVQAEKLAALWGLQKNRLSMTYEKLSRGMRYYYSNNIISKEQSKRLLYRFMRSPDEIRKTMKRNSETTTSYSTVSKKPSNSWPSTTSSHNEEASRQTSNRYLEFFSVHSPSPTPTISNQNPIDSGSLITSNNSTLKSDRSSSSSPASFDSNYDSEKQNRSPAQSSKCKQSSWVSLKASSVQGCTADQPLNLVVQKEDSSPFNYKKQRLIYTQSSV